MKRPCPYCGARLLVRVDTDGQGGTVETVDPCDCEDARWRRGECIVDGCGVKVPRTHPKRLGRKRCPKHHQAELRRRARLNMRRHYRENLELERARHRIWYREKARKDPLWWARKLARNRHDREVMAQIQGRQWRWLPEDIQALRDRLAYRLREDEGWTYRAIGEAMNRSESWAKLVYRQQVEARKPELRRAA